MKGNGNALKRIQDRLAVYFPELDQEDLERLAAVTRLSTFRKGEWIFSEGESLGTADWLVSGNVVLLKNSLAGRNSILHVVRQEHFVDHCSLFGSGKAIVSASALGRCELLRIDARTLRAVLGRNAAFSLRLMRALSVRQRMFINKMTVSQGKISVRRRVAGWILHKMRVEKTNRLKDEVTREVLAGLLGVSRESLCRQISRFAQEGTLRLESKTMIVEDEAALRRCLDD